MPTINDLATTPSYVEASFAFSPSVPYTFTAPNGKTLTAPSAYINQITTFTATTIIDNQGNDLTGPLSIVEYRWNFGDGAIGYGNPALHTYVIDNPQVQATLRVTDSLGRQWFSRAQLYLPVSMSGVASLPLLFPIAALNANPGKSSQLPLLLTSS